MIQNDELLRDMRGRLLARGDELRDRIKRIRADLHRELAPLPSDSTEAAIAVENDEVLAAIEMAAKGELVHIDHALDRIGSGTFGRCERCGAPIQTERLQAVPYAVRCRECESRG